MNEKISEIPIREEKIRKLKEKVLKEIDKYLEQNRRDIKIYLMNNENEVEDWDFMITEEFSLLRLKDYIEDGRTFWSYEARYNDIDRIIYQVSDRKLNIWLQDDYNFALNFLCKIEYEKHCDVYELLNDRYFGYEFTNIFDEIKYDDRMKNSN